MEKIIMFGTGGLSKNALLQIDKTKYEVIEFWDNDSNKWDTEFEGVKVIKPHSECGDVDKIIIASSFYGEIFEQLTKELGIDSYKISNYLWFDKVGLLEYYNTHSKEIDDEIREILAYLESHNLEVFNYEINKRYKDIEVIINYDSETKLFYVYHDGKKMYMKRSLDSERKVRDYYISLLVEQDKESPHCYGEYIQNEKYDTLIDAGCAEGNFVLDHIEKAGKVFIVENDEEWLEALHYTLAIYGEKVTIINKYLSDYDNEKNVTLNELFMQQHISTKEKCLIKLDIEGAEEKAIIGGKEIIELMDDITIITCTYHNKNAGKILNALLQQMGMETEFSKGYMFFPAEYERQTVTDIGMERRNPDLRRGLLIGRKRECEKDKLLDLYAEEIFELYVRDYEIESFSYKMMGKLLESEWVKNRLQLYNVDSLYIYGGGYLGIQLYNAIYDMADVKAIVDKNGGLSVDVKGIRVISLDDLMKEYSSEKIIITPIRYYQAIKKDLLNFSDEKEILFLGEFLEGIVQ